MIMLAYDTPAGRAWYVDGSGLAGEPQYTLSGRTLSHAAVLALASRRNRRGRRVPTADAGALADKERGRLMQEKEETAIDRLYWTWANRGNNGTKNTLGRSLRLDVQISDSANGYGYGIIYTVSLLESGALCSICSRPMLATRAACPVHDPVLSWHVAYAERGRDLDELCARLEMRVARGGLSPPRRQRAGRVHATPGRR